MKTVCTCTGFVIYAHSMNRQGEYGLLLSAPLCKCAPLEKSANKSVTTCGRKSATDRQGVG
jgi:hypothetical protein